MERLSRRQILQILGAGAVGVHCGGGGGEDLGSNASALAATPTPRQMLDGIDNFVVVMMENRSFDHYMGALRREKAYKNESTIDGSRDTDWNPSPEGHRVYIHDADTYTLQSPPHTFPAAHRQWDNGRNDRFVIEHAGEYQDQAMAFYDRRQIPFYYWLADEFTIFDHWHASVMGPTTPNRLYLNTGTSVGSEVDAPITKDVPDTIWDRLRENGTSAMNYHAGRSALISHVLPSKTAAGKIPFAKMDKFFSDAAAGTLPSVSFIDPDYQTNDDHPVHDIRLGQAFVASIYKALTKSPQWSKSLLIVLYDEHGGFWDHVPPPAAMDAYKEFRRFGFRVPAFVAGPTVRRGHLARGLHDHTSVLATLSLRYKLRPLSERAANAEVIDYVFDPALFKNPKPPPKGPDPIPIDAEALESVGQSSQEELEAAIDSGAIPEEYIDRRPLNERLGSWLEAAQRVGAVTLVD